MQLTKRVRCLFLVLSFYFITEHPACAIFATRIIDAKIKSFPDGVIQLLVGEKLIPAGCADMISSLKRAVCIDHKNLRIFTDILLKSDTRVELGNAIMDDYGILRFSHYYCL